MKKPELLAPAGSPESLKAAISAGADAVYMGLSKFNARQNADNFGREELVEAVRLCKFYNKKLYITLNTLVFDREISEVLGEARFCAEAGVDAFIVQDLGTNMPKFNFIIRAKFQPRSITHSKSRSITSFPNTNIIIKIMYYFLHYLIPISSPINKNNFSVAKY